MHIEIETNLNCEKSGFFVFDELETARPVLGLRMVRNGKEMKADVIGVEAQDKFAQAFSQKIQDSGAGFGYLIYGGQWGIRFRPSFFRHEPWDISNRNQWGEAYLVYAEEADLIFSST